MDATELRTSTSLRIDPGQRAQGRAAFERIVESAQTLLDGRDWDSITLEEICLAADVSSSSFYRRFGSKEALLREVHRRWLAERHEAAVESIGAIDWSTISTREVLATMCRMYIADRSAISARALSMLRVQVTHPILAADRAANDRANLLAISSALAAVLDKPETDIRFAVQLMASGIWSAIQPPAPFIQVLGWDEDELVERCVDAFVRVTELEL